jgi:hypothetical protein
MQAKERPLKAPQWLYQQKWQQNILWPQQTIFLYSEINYKRIDLRKLLKFKIKALFSLYHFPRREFLYMYLIT